MIEIVCGTNRPGSVSATIAEIYADLLRQRGQSCEIVDLSALPADFTVSALYDNAGANEAFNRLANRLRQVQKMVFIVPEYNNSFPGVLKAFIDGMDYPSPFKGKKCALVGVSSGVQGGGMAMSHLTDIFNYLGMHVLAQKPRLAQIEKNLEGDRLTNALYQQLLEEQVESLLVY
ncbi:NADPH-dependent FMN reductase [Cesiribacter andamanensis]|uniref:Putative flavoprotein n=1 Tax=Cesiribacter andamanensis AMV16 TaxID=1279009 RepID=M7NP98_9BACT|nr:NAD(P)H-dependent oxidoreductase [Cesiribacter andamanensis]EMR03550.1 putative flavoprotein [Cesiribacter andamanensis AMV16]